MFLTIPDGHLFATKYGPKTAPAIIGIGGWIGSSELWTEPFSLLSDEWATIAYDHRGSGVSVVRTESITPENLIDDVFAVLDAYGVDRCVLAAESMGALTALGAALARPERVSHLVIVDGMYHRPRSGEPDPFLTGLRMAYPETIERFVQACVPETGCEQIKAWGRQILARALPEAAIALRILSAEVDLLAQIPGIQQPTLVIHGEKDLVVPIERGRELAAMLPNAEFVELPGAGHVPTLTRPVEVAGAMAAFLRRTR